MKNINKQQQSQIWAFNYNQQFSFVGQVSIKKIVSQLRLIFGKFSICWPNYEVVQWSEGMLLELQTYLSNNLNPKQGLVAVFEHQIKTISIVKKQMIKTSDTVNFQSHKKAFQKQFQHISAIITNCFSFSGLKKSILTQSTPKDKLLIYNKYLKTRKTLRRSFNQFLNQLFSTKVQIYLKKMQSNANVVDQFEFTFANIQKVEKQSNFMKYFLKVNKYLAMFVDFFKENGKQNRNKSKIQEVSKFDSTVGDIQIHGGISKVIKVYINGSVLTNANTSQEIKVEGNCLAKKCYKTEESSEIKNNATLKNKVEGNCLAKKCNKAEESSEKKSDATQKNNQMRFHRQIQQIEYLSKQESIFKDCYLVNYYYVQNERLKKNFYYANWHELSLNAYLKIHQGTIRIQEKLHIAIQAVMIVLDLHRIGMVHRDLKSSNFMLDTSGRQVPVLKLIDLSDSMVIGDEQMLQNVKSDSPKLFSTPLYCPIETSTLHDKHKEIGIDKKEIDFWSIGILLYEIFHGCVPISYSSLTSKDILTLWPTQFLSYLTQRPRKNAMVVHQIIVFLSFSLCKINQNQRMRLETVLVILLATFRLLNQNEEDHGFFHENRKNMSAA